MVECRTRVDVSGRFVVACAMLIGPTLTPWCVTTDDDGLDDSTTMVRTRCEPTTLLAPSLLLANTQRSQQHNAR